MLGVGTLLTDVSGGVYDGADKLTDTVSHHLGVLANLLDFLLQVCRERGDI